jgi:hypothetical protein
MFKMICLLKRKDGMSVADFRAYYESRHRVLALDHMRDVERYTRKYLDPLDPSGGADQPYDVVTEIACRDRAALDRFLAGMTLPEVAALITEDEGHLFDRPSMRFYTVDEREDVPGAA